MPERRIRQVAGRAEALLPGMPGFADRFEDYLARGWFSLASPIWANFGLGRGLPLSCFGSYAPDSLAGILGTAAEVGVMSKYGGGTSAYFGDVRGRGAPITDDGTSEGSVDFMRLFDTLIDVTKQGATRRGSFAAYLPIDHPDVEEFLAIRDGDPAKRRVWARVLQQRSEVGLPYLLFTDAAQRGAPEVYRERGMPIRSSNLCTEIMLPVADDESFVCCLSSLNLLHADEWLGTDAVEVLVAFLDAVLTEFIERSGAIPELARARRFASRHATLLAVAPTTSSAFILGQVSQSIEPIRSNFHVRDLAKSVTSFKNPQLEAHLRDIGADTPATWRSILEHGGSVQHLDVLDDEAKRVFATFAEVSQLDLVIQAAQRQAFIDQGQSLNLMAHPDTPARDLNALHLAAWERGVKSLDYQHSLNAAQRFHRDPLTSSACEA